MPGELDVATLASAPYAGPLSFGRRAATQDLDGVDVAVVGIPFDTGTTYRPGARLGPRAIREQSLFVAQYSWGHRPWECNSGAGYRFVPSP